jgi:hypothetical protein
VNIVRVADHFLCRFNKGEKGVLWGLLKLYPCLSSGTLLGLPGKPDSSKQLLEEALSEQRLENKKRVQTFLERHHGSRDSEQGLQFSVSSAELEWLLQILNDVRIGSWILLGSPDKKLELKLLDERTAPHFWAMEMAGHFEMLLLSALQD